VEVTVGVETSDRTESTLGGRYLFESRIAAGGMGEVWQAYDEVLGRPVAVKLLRSEYVNDPTFRDRFRTEARNTAALSHPGIVQVYDFGETKIGSGSAATTLPYIAMELVSGEPLSTMIAREGALGIDRAASIVAQAAVALQAAHASGVVHRDVKPANLLITPTGTVKVTDFGIARAAHAVSLTSGNMIVGTAQYLAPEQTGSRSPATPRSDVYALGVVLYECVSGRHPFPADSPIAVALAHQHESPAPLPDHIPAAMSDLVRRMLAKDPAERPKSAAAVHLRRNGAKG
jgi:serine/threonine-protein kinase